MQTNRLAWLSAGAALALGAAVYLLGRDWSTVYFLHWAAGAEGGGPLLDLGAWAGSAPSFVHAFGFSLLTAVLLRGGPLTAAAACLFWAATNTLFELFQQPGWAVAVPPLPDFLAGLPLLENLGAYFRFGQFDVHDLIAIAAGSAAAWLLSLRINTPAGSLPAFRRAPHV